jgi:hypothetical protein
MEGIQHPIPRTVEEVFSDFRGRRAGLIKALSTGQLDLSFSIYSVSFDRILDDFCRFASFFYMFSARFFNWVFLIS